MNRACLIEFPEIESLRSLKKKEEKLRPKKYLALPQEMFSPAGGSVAGDASCVLLLFG